MVSIASVCGFPKSVRQRGSRAPLVHTIILNIHYYFSFFPYALRIRYYTFPECRAKHLLVCLRSDLFLCYYHVVLLHAHSWTVFMNLIVLLQGGATSFSFCPSLIHSSTSSVVVTACFSTISSCALSLSLISPLSLISSIWNFETKLQE
jgi:hypothetical protein